MISELDQNGELRWRRIYAIFAAALILFYMLCPAAPLRWNALYLTYGKAAIFSLIAIYFYKCGFRGSTETKLLILYAVWMLLSRLLNTDYYLENENDLVISRFLCCVIFPLGTVLRPEERGKLLDVVAAVSGLFYFVTALIGIYTCVFGVYIYLPPENVVFGLDNNFLYNTFYYIVAWETNRTISAVWFYLAWCMMIYEFFRCRNKLWRVPIVLAWLVYSLAIAFCFCRNIKFAVCVNMAMLVVLMGIKYLRVKKNSVKTLVVVLLALISLPLSYKSFDLLTDLTGLAYNALDTDIERTSDQFFNPGAIDENADTVEFEDKRSVGESASTISNRGSIYASVIPTLKEDPMRMLIGKYSGKLMDIPNKYTDFPYFHMHNYLLQVLMLTGIPGLLLALAFSVLIVVKCVKLFFSSSPLLGFAEKSLIFPVSGILLYGMFEIILFTQSADSRALTDFRELFFFLLAGMIVGYYNDVFGNKNCREVIK